MRKIILIALIALLFNACKNDVAGIQNPELSLVSPKGRVLAKNFSEVKDKIIGNEEVVKKEDIYIKTINYYDNDDYSVAVVDCLIKDEFHSILIPIDLGKDYFMLSDKHTIEFVKNFNDSFRQVIGQDKKILPIGNLNIIGMGVAHCQGGDCCSWTQTGPNRYNCGCNDNAVIITTSDGCEVDIREEKTQ